MLHFKFLLLFTSFLWSSKLMANNSVFLCYGKVPVQDIMNYEYVIVEASHYSASEVAVLKQHNQLVVCYISLGEFNKYTTFFNSAKKHALPGKNENWDSYYLDLSQKPLHEILLKDIKEKILFKGFDGLFLDNIDNFCSYGQQKHQQPYLIDLLKTIRKDFPTIHLMQNAGLEALEHTGNLVNSVAIESIITNYNFSKKEYGFRNKKDFKQLATNLKLIQEKYTLPFIIIEYVDRKKDLSKIERKLQRYNWHLFIGQIDLQDKPTFK